MVIFDGVTDINVAFDLGDKAAEWITAKFPDLIILEMEKIYYPYLLMRKKRYAGLMYVKDKKGNVQLDGLDAKGIELVRRDNCKLAKKIQQEALDAIMYKRDRTLAVECIQAGLTALVNNEYDIDMYKMSKGLRKDYVNENLAHVVVANKMKARDPGSEPQVGDRVPFVYLETGGPKAKASEKAEDIKYTLDNNLKIDRLYYLEHQIEKPICGMMDIVISNPEKLFTPFKIALTLQQTKQRTLTSMGMAPTTTSSPVITTFTPVKPVNTCKKVTSSITNFGNSSNNATEANPASSMQDILMSMSRTLSKPLPKRQRRAKKDK